MYGTVRTTDLFIRNTSASGVNIEGDVYASANYQNAGAPVSGNPIHVGEGGFGIETDTTLSGDQSIDGVLTLDGNSLKIDGSLTVTDGISLKGATLLITGNLTVTGGSISVDENSVLIVDRRAHITASGITQNGEMTVGQQPVYLQRGYVGAGRADAQRRPAVRWRYNSGQADIVRSCAAVYRFQQRQRAGC